MNEKQRFEFMDARPVSIPDDAALVRYNAGSALGNTQEAWIVFHDIGSIMPIYKGLPASDNRIGMRVKHMDGGKSVVEGICNPHILARTWSKPEAGIKDDDEDSAPGKEDDYPRAPSIRRPEPIHSL